MNNGLYPNGLNHHRSLKFQKLRKLISQNQAKVKIEGLYGSSLSFLLIDIYSSLNTQIFYLSNSKESASYTYTDIVEFLGEDNCNLLPSNYRNYNNKIKDESNVLNRTKTIKDLTEKKAKIKPIYLKKGQAIVWAANLLHGGTKHINKKLTRKSQVIHYHFKGCSKYYNPGFSVPSVGDYAIRELDLVKLKN